MALLGKTEIIEALCRLGEFASADAKEVSLAIVGGAAMVFGFDAPLSAAGYNLPVLCTPEQLMEGTRDD